MCTIMLTMWGFNMIDDLGSRKYCWAGGGDNKPWGSQTERISGEGRGLSETSTQTNGKAPQVDQFQNDQG